MQLIIQGDDKRKAKTWIEFAKNKLRQIKRFTPATAPINRSFRPVPDIFVHIRSVNGLDAIRIVTEGGKYLCNFPQVDRYPIPHSDFLLQCPVKPSTIARHLTITFFSMTKDWGIGGDWENYNWDFGDGEVGTGRFLSHEYEKPGEYEVSLTVSKDISTYNAPSGEDGSGEYKAGWSNYSSDGFGAHEDIAYARYQAYPPLIVSHDYEWTCTAGTSRSYIGGTPVAKHSFGYESAEPAWTFNLTSVAPGSTVTCYIKLLLLDWLEGYPNFEDSGFQVDGVSSNVLSNIGGSAIPIIGGQYAPWETFNMGDLSPFIGTTKVVQFSDAAGHVQLPAFPPGIPPEGNTNTYSNRVGIRGSDAWAVVESAGTQMKTTKTIKVYTGRRGNKRTSQVGDSVHT